MEELINLRNNGYPVGQYPGFENLYKIFSWKKGYPVYIAGAPHHGKTQFVIEQLIFKSTEYGERHCCYFGETGNKAEIYGELIHSVVKKPFMKYKSEGVFNDYAMTDKEFYGAMDWVKYHFEIVESFEPFTMWGFYNRVEKLEKQLNIKFDTTCIDPFMHLEIPEKFGGQDHKHLKEALKFCNDNSKKNNRINILINHIADLPYQTDANNNRYYPLAMPNEWAGGRMWHRFAYTMLLVYRCTKGILQKNGEPYEENQAIIENQKAKPKGSGKLGQAVLFWDWQKNRYFQKEFETKIYANGKTPL